jgi:endonuclease/exonuclease/phosphatase family metal-dependent hydrolase
MSKPEVSAILADIVSTADIIAVQEVRSAAIDPVEQFMAMLPERYRYIIGPRQGRSSSKEQYWIIYDAEKFTVNEMEVWHDEEDIFERSPFVVFFQSSGNFDFFLINNHIQPGAASKEISALPSIVEHYRNSRNEPDFLIVGDFNADGQYYDENNLENIFGADEYSIIITGEHDTTVAQSENTYDRFIITSSAAEDYTGNHGIVRFDNLYDFEQSDIQPKNVSDHYPVWAEFWLDRDTD